MHYIVKEDIENITAEIKNEAKALEGKTLLISGGAGFIGSYVVGTIQMLNRKYFSKPCRVISVDNYITSSEESFIDELLDENVSVIKADIRNLTDVKEPVHYIIHAAGLASPYYYRKYPLETIDTAIIGAKNLLELSLKNRLESFLLFSSSEIYGDPDDSFIPTPETYRGNVSSVGPRSCYDESKRLAETIAMTYYHVYGAPVKIVRPFNVYGPGMKTNDYRVIPTFIARGIAGETLPVHDKGNQTRTFCYVSDATAGFLKALLSSKNGEVYNIGTEFEEINMIALANAVADFFEPRPKATLVKYPDSYPADEPRRRCPDITKLRKELGYDPKINLHTGLARTITWFQDTLPKDFKFV